MKTFALAGNPNSGKTTLFNTLTGATAYVGNWPGVTVEKKEGKYKSRKNGVEGKIVDLPGIYSLSPYTMEELIARNYILNEKPDAIIDVVDVTNLERNLYLTSQLLEMDVPVILALNMADVLTKEGIDVDTKKLEEVLGVPVVLVSALKKQGMDELMERAEKESRKARTGTSFLLNGSQKEKVLQAKSLYEKEGISNPLFHAIKALENDEEEAKCHPDLVKEVAALTKEGEEFEAVSADERYRFISANCSPAKKDIKVQSKDKLTVSDKIDRVLTNRFAGIPIFLVVLLLMFALTFSEDFFFLGRFGVHFDAVCFEGSYFEGLFWNATEYAADGTVAANGGINSIGVILTNFLAGVLDWLSDLLNLGLESAGTAPWAIGFVNSIVVDGVFAVLGFLPQILTLFFFFSILEDSGYMARVAFIFDRIFRRMGLSGRAFIPMLMGYGCGVPAMINTRTLNTDKERVKTIRAIAFFPCGAKMTLLAAIAGVLSGNFGLNATLISYSFYIIGLVLAIAMVILMHWTTQREKVPPFIMELPSYHLPQFGALMIHMWDKTKHYLKKITTVVLISAIVIWAFTHLTWNWTYIDPEEIVNASYNGVAIDPELWEDFVAALQAEDTAALGEILGIDEGLVDLELAAYENLGYGGSILHDLSAFVSPLFVPLGFGPAQVGADAWAYTLSSVTGIVAKEVVPDTLIIVSSGNLEGFVEASGITVGGFYAFVVFNLMTIPCFASIGTAKAELPKGSLKWTILFWVATSYVLGAIVYLAIDFVWTLAIIIPAIVALFVLAYLYNRKMNKKEAALAS